ncbi:MAG: AsmA family protein [Gammaproteobacteria bacterium]
MKSLLKWLLAGIALLLVLGIAVAVAVATLVDAERLRPAIADGVQQATGRTLALDGDVGLKLFPCCAVEVTRATLGNPPGFAAGPFLAVGSARLSIRLWPLLSRRELQIGTVRIEGLEANLVGRKDGSNNWTFTDSTTKAPEGGGQDDAPAIGAFNLAGISIKDARVEYSDEADGSRYRVQNLQLDTGPVRDGEPFDLSTSFRLTDLADNSGGGIRLKAQTRVAIDGDITTVTLGALESEVDTRGLAGLKVLGGSLRAPDLIVRLADNTTLRASGLTAELQLKDADLPGGAAAVQASATDFAYDVDAGAGTFGGFTAKTNLAGIDLDITGKGSFGARNDLHGTLRFPEFSPRAALTELKAAVPKTADPKVLTRLSGSAEWFFREASAGLEKLAIVLDDTKVAGSLARQLLPAASKATPRTRFDLTIDRLDADRYLEPDAPAPDQQGAPDKRADPPTRIPTATLRALNVEGRARIGQLTVTDLHMADVDVSVAADGGRLRLEPLAASLYGGKMRGGFRLDATGDKSRLVLDQAMTGVDFAELIGDFADVRNITGTMNMKLTGTAVGATDDELLENLDGNLAFTLADGTYKGMDVWYEIRRARALIRRLAPPARTGPEETPIKLLDLAGKLNDGQLRTDRFTAEIPFLRVSGDASVNLPQATLDSKLTALVFEKPVFGDDTSLEDLVNFSIPLTISGPVADPKVRVDLGKMMKSAATDALRQSLEQKLRDKLGLGKPAEEAPPADGQPAAPPADPVNKLLDRLFKKGT